ncbi:GMC oxidoreductase [Piloderma croceum F 1598]|uniref:GMC oxidoreductase n=1 Tax=Piloderma croceum (strain F 1598) TaxID=765440 RepID=A0A0C3FIE6_PILCF|nr:GMC oxidoreductase [Piloderma croceum F 1598]
MALGLRFFVIALAASSTLTAAVLQSYDYIVIGAGTAGATIAARIVEDPSVTVAVLEASDSSAENNPLAFIPGADTISIGSSPLDTVSYDWNFVTIPQTGAANRKMHYARGKGIGGTLQHNFMIYQRPTSDSFSYWINATNGTDFLPGWSWNDVYPYFIKSIILSPPDNSLHRAAATLKYNSIPAAYPETDNTKVPLPIGFANFAFEYSATLQSAFNELQYPNALDFSSSTLNGVQYDTSTLDHSNGHCSSSQYFINNAQKLSNLHIITNTMAQKINFDSNKTAISVTYTSLLSTVMINVTREVIVSAGVFQSPQLLMLSGIGPSAQLQKFNIPVLVDLPGVGQNLQDHVFFSPGYEINPSIYQFGHETQILNLLVADFLGWQKLNETFISTKPELSVLSTYPPLWPHIEYISAGGLIGKFTDLLVANAAPALINKFYYLLLGALVAPQSRRSVTLASNSASTLPVIDLQQTKQFQLRCSGRSAEFSIPLHLCRSEITARNSSQSTDAQLLSVIQNSLQSVWHASCTCAMQPRSNNGVLDPYLRAYGVNGVHVVDASSFPSLLPGHPQSVVYMLAERAAVMRPLTG